MALTLPKELIVRIGANAAGLQRAGAQSQAILNRIGTTARRVTASVVRIGSALTGIGVALAIRKILLEPFEEVRDAVAKLREAGGELRDTIGQIIIRAIDLNGGAGALSEKIKALNERIRENGEKWIAWTQVVFRSVQAVTKTLGGLVRVAFNIGQMIGRAFDIAGLSMIGAFAEAIEQIKRLANRIPGVNFEERQGPNPFFAAAAAQVEAFKGDLADIVDAGTDVGEAWAEVAQAIERARDAAGELAEIAPAIDIPDLPGRTVPVSGPSVYTGGVNVPSKGLEALPVQEDVAEATFDLANATDVAVDSIERMAEAVVLESGRMEIALITSLQNVIANIRNKQTGQLFGSTLLGGIVGVGLGLVGSLFERRKSGPMPVTVSSYEPRALSQMQQNSGPQRVTVVIEQAGVPVEVIERELYGRQLRDEIVRYSPRTGHSLRG